MDTLCIRKKRRVLFEKKKIQQLFIHDVHEGLGAHPKAKGLASHRGREPTYKKTSEILLVQYS